MVARHDDVAVLAEWLNSCVCAYLDDVSTQIDEYPGCPGQVCVTAGQPAHDNCCKDGGQLNTWVDRIYPSSKFPDEDEEARGTKGCPQKAAMAVVLGISIIRCAPTETNNGRAPTCDQLSQNALLVHTDAQVLYEAIECCMSSPAPGKQRTYQHLIGHVTVDAPEGGCVASTGSVTVNIGRPCACHPDSDS